FRPRRSPGRSEVPARELQRHACGDTRARCGSSEARQSGAAAWGSTAAQLALPGLRRAKTSDERDVLIHELARTVELEASHQFGTDPALGAVWCAAAREAACARLRAVGWYGPQAHLRAYRPGV